jgi:hypothetical protein
MDVKEQLDDGDVYRFYCPPGCLAMAASLGANVPVVGTDIYWEESSICMAAVHAGVINDGGVCIPLPPRFALTDALSPTLPPSVLITGACSGFSLQGLLSVEIRTQFGPGAGRLSIGHNRLLSGTARNGITTRSQAANVTAVRTFAFLPYPEATMEVETLAGYPASPLTERCGYVDTQPPIDAKVCVHRIACARWNGQSVLRRVRVPHMSCYHVTLGVSTVQFAAWHRPLQERIPQQPRAAVRRGV